MPNYEHLYTDVFENPNNYSNTEYHANGVFDRSPIFIGGTGRSGTTIMARVLSQHPDTLNFVEVRFLLVFKRKIDLKKKMPPFYRNKNTYEKITRGLRVAGYRDANTIYSKKIIKNICLNDASTATKRFFEIGLRAWNKSVVIEKTPHTVLVVDTLHKIFPNIRYIHIFRDPRDVFASVKSVHWGPSKAKNFIPWYNKVMYRAYEIKKRIPRRNYLLVRFEDFVNDSPGELKKVFKFTNLKFKNEYTKMISKSGAHINRYANELNKKELDTVWSGCKKIYTKWKRLYKKERK